MAIELPKVGIQILNDECLENIFPDYQRLLNNIEECRNRINDIPANSSANQKRSRHYQDNLMYDNVFSIIGKRGMGKTSVIFTLKKKIFEDAKNIWDIELPIITPDAISREDGILDWILALLADKVQEIEKQCKSNMEEQFDINCKYQESETVRNLKDKYDKLLELNFSERYKPNNAYSYYEVVGYATKQTQNSYKLVKEMEEFWDELIGCQKKIANNEHIEPLIYFFFDDVDLAPEKVESLLTVIRTYLAHPHIIVVMSADEEVFLEVLENSIDSKMKRPQKDVRKFLQTVGAKFERAEFSEETDAFYINNAYVKDDNGMNNMARMYLGKVMPPSTRYYLSMFENLDEKKNFICDIKGKNELLFDVIIKQVDELRKSVGGNSEDFLHYGKEQITFYLYFIGDTARQIGNEIWIIRDFVDNLTGIDGSKKRRNTESAQVYKYVYRFMRSSIVANHSLAGVLEDEEDFIHELLKRDYSGWKIYMNYYYINQYFDRKIDSGADNISSYEMGVKLYALAFFVENIIYIWENGSNRKDEDKRRERLHGKHPFINFLQMCGMESGLFNSLLELPEFLYHYSEVFAKFSVLSRNDLAIERFAERYFDCFTGIAAEDFSDGQVYGWYLYNEKWFRKICQQLFILHDGLEVIEKETLEDTLYHSDEEFRFLYEVNMRAQTEEVLYRFIEEPLIKEYAYETMENVKNVMAKGEASEKDTSAASPIDYDKIDVSGELIPMSEVVNQLADKADLRNKENIRDWVNEMLYAGIVRTERDLEHKIQTLEGWIEILSTIKYMLAYYKKDADYIVINNADSVLEDLDDLEDYKYGVYQEQIGKYAEMLNGAKKRSGKQRTMLKYNRNAKKMIESFFDIYKDIEHGIRIRRRAYGVDYQYYRGLCRKIFEQIDIAMQKEKEKERLDNFAILWCLYKKTQELYYCYLINMNRETKDSGEIKEENYYSGLYQFIYQIISISDEKQRQLSSEDAIFRNKIREYIVESRNDYIDKLIAALD